MDEIYIYKDLARLYMKTMIQLAALIEENLGKDDYSLFYDNCIEFFGEEFTEDAVSLAINMKRFGY